jgi:subfamily B ATP-binding cassette protein MsbA
MRSLLNRAFAFSPWSVLVIAVVSIGIAALEGAGLGLILPIIEGINTDQEVAPSHAISEVAFRVLDWLGLPFSTTMLVLLGLVLFSLQSALLWVKTVTVTHVRVGVETAMRAELFERFLAASVSYFDDQRLGRLSNAVVVEASRASSALLHLLNALVTSTLVIAYFAVAVVISWKLALVALGFVAAFGLVLRGTRSLKRRGQQVTAANAVLQNTTVEYLSAIREVNALGLQAHANDLFRQSARRVAREVFLTERLVAGFRSVYELAAVAVTAALMAIGVLWLDVEAAAIVAFFVLLFRLAPRLILMQNSLYKFVAASPGHDELRELMAVVDENLMARPAAPKPPTLSTGIALDDVSFAYDGAHNVLDGVSFTIERGMTVGVVGASGAGKSTLVDLLLRFADPTGGRITVDGVDLRELDIDAWRGMIGFVGQETFLFHESIYHNLWLGNPRATREQVEAAAAMAGADEFIERLPEGYETVIGDRGVMLSGGQRQRLALARALVRDPQVLLLDEATSDLDSRSQAMIQESIGAMHGVRTVIVVAHRLSTIRDSDVIIVLDGGRISEMGTHADLMERGGHYAGFYATELGGPAA